MGETERGRALALRDLVLVPLPRDDVLFLLPLLRLLEEADDVAVPDISPVALLPTSLYDSARRRPTLFESMDADEACLPPLCFIRLRADVDVDEDEVKLGDDEGDVAALLLASADAIIFLVLRFFLVSTIAGLEEDSVM